MLSASQAPPASSSLPKRDGGLSPLQTSDLTARVTMLTSPLVPSFHMSHWLLTLLLHLTSKLGIFFPEDQMRISQPPLGWISPAMTLDQALPKHQPHPHPLWQVTCIL